MLLYIILNITSFFLQNLPIITYKSISNKPSLFINQLDNSNKKLNLCITKQKLLYNKFDLKNEILYLVNRRIKVYIYIEQLIENTNIYHVGISFNSIFDSIRYDLRGYNALFYYNFLNPTLKEYTYLWGYTNKTLDEIKQYEANLNYKYILGFNDCRHYVKNLTIWSTNSPTPVWQLNTLIKKIETK